MRFDAWLGSFLQIVRSLGSPGRLSLWPALNELSDLGVVRVDLLEKGDHGICELGGVRLDLGLEFRAIEIDEETAHDVAFHGGQNLLVLDGGQVQNRLD